MSLFIKKYQFKNRKMQAAHNKWFGRAVMVDEVSLEELADEIQDNCTVKRSDILAVMSELGPAMKRWMQKSMKVKIPYLGSFRLAVKSTGVDAPEEYDLKKNVKGVKVLFRPEESVDNGHRVKEMTRGVRVAELPKNLTTLPDDDDNGGGGDDNTAITEP
jgi:predicted histone-like DNA-binding protein